MRVLSCLAAAPNTKEGFPSLPSPPSPPPIYPSPTCKSDTFSSTKPIPHHLADPAPSVLRPLCARRARAEPLPVCQPTATMFHRPTDRPNERRPTERAATDRPTDRPQPPPSARPNSVCPSVSLPHDHQCQLYPLFLLLSFSPSLSTDKSSFRRSFRRPTRVFCIESERTGD